MLSITPFLLLSIVLPAFALSFNSYVTEKQLVELEQADLQPRSDPYSTFVKHCVYPITSPPYDMNGSPVLTLS